MAVDIIARALAAKALNGGGSGSGGDCPPFSTDGPTTYEVGGIPAGTILKGKTWEQIFTMMLYGTAVPVLTNPSLTIKLNKTSAESGSTAMISGQAIFDRGSIEPAYGTSGFRAGAPLYYEVNGVKFNVTNTICDFEITLPIQEGDNEVVVTVYYGEGEQPLDGMGNPYDAPYPAGSLSETAIVSGGYSIYVKNSNGEYVSLGDDVDFDENGELVVDVPGEKWESTDKQSVAFDAKRAPIVGIQQYDPSRDLFDWIYGSPEESLEGFDQAPVTIDVNGQEVDFNAFNNNTVTIGPRRLKFFTKLPNDDSN